MCDYCWSPLRICIVVLESQTPTMEKFLRAINGYVISIVLLLIEAIDTHRQWQDRHVLLIRYYWRRVSFSRYFKFSWSAVSCRDLNPRVLCCEAYWSDNKPNVWKAWSRSFGSKKRPVVVVVMHLMHVQCTYIKSQTEGRAGGRIQVKFVWFPKSNYWYWYIARNKRRLAHIR